MPDVPSATPEAAGGGTPSPSPADTSSPSPGSPGTVSAGVEYGEGDTGFSDYSGLGVDDDALGAISVEVPREGGEAEATPPVAPPTPTEAKPEPTPPSPPQGQQQTQQPAAEPQGAQEASPQQWVQQLAQHENAVLDELAQTRFALSQEEVAALEENAVAAVPRLLAKVYFQSVTATLNHISNLVPKIIAQQATVRSAYDKAENEFYSQFPQLDRTKHGQDVVQFAKAFRAANPRMPAPDLMKLIGAAVMAKHGLTAQPSRPNGRVSQPPFVPAQGGGSTRMTPEPENPYAGLGQDFDE